MGVMIILPESEEGRRARDAAALVFFFASCVILDRVPSAEIVQNGYVLANQPEGKAGYQNDQRKSYRCGG